MVNISLRDVVCGINSGRTITHKAAGAYAVYGSTGIIGRTDNPEYSGERILVARVGANAGTTNFVSGQYGVSDNTLIVEVKPTCDARYIFYSLKFAKLNQLVFGSGQPLITGSLLKDIELHIPPKDAQTQIVDVLSNIDKYIQIHEQLVAKKKAIKQGAMQELLTGKKRLPGFTGEWKNYQLRDLGEFLKGSGISRAESNTGKIPAVRYGELYTHHHNYVVDYISRISKDVAVKAKQVYKGDILFAASGETKEEIGKCAAIISQETVYAGGDILVFRPSVHLNPIFMGTLLNTTDVCKQRAEKGQGDAVVHIHADSLGSIKIRIPEISEQDAIADILFEMDKEIKLIKHKLEKYRQVKQGMMQQLLTGKIRLVQRRENE